MAALSPAATVASESLLFDVKETVLPFWRRLMVSPGFSLPLPITAPFAVACAATAVMFTAHDAAVRFLLLGLETTLTVESLTAPSDSNRRWTDVGSDAK